MSGTQPLVALLEELRAELRVQDNPERRAFSRLQPKPSGAVAEPYAKDAFQIWSDMLREVPGDLRTAHHLAIMHHARAFDQEASSNGRAVAEDWKQALDLWHRLWKEDAFWQGLGEGFDEAGALFAEVRAGWPERLLDVHFAVAFEEGTPDKRRRAHVRLALDSPFPAEVKDSVRMRAYERVTRAVPAVVWESGTFDPETLGMGLKAVDRYLDLDGELLPALRDLLGLLTKLQTGYVQQTNAIGDEEEEGFHAKLRELQELVRRYEPRVAYLESRRKELEPGTLADLALWHARAGQANKILDEHELAASHYRRAFLAASGDPSDARRAEEMREEWLDCTFLCACQHAAKGKDGASEARRLLKEVAKEDLPPGPRMRRANVHLLLHDFTAAQKEGEQALARLQRDQNGTDFPAAEKAARLEPQCRKLLATIQRARRQHEAGPKLEAAGTALERDDTAKALRLLDEALKIDPESGPALFLRAQCHLKDLELASARRDVDHAARLVAEGGDAQALEAMQLLRRQIGEAERHVEELGGLKAFRLRQKGIAAFNNDRFREAADLLRQALKAAAPQGRQKLEQELAACLRNQAGEVFEPAGDQARAGDFSAARKTCDQALALAPDFFPALFLRAQCHMEAGDLAAAAGDLDQAEASARQAGLAEALQAVARLRNDLRQLERVAAENGGPQALRLQQRAVEAFNADRLGEAADLLRQALKAAARGKDKKLKQELAVCLDLLAVQQVNEAITKLQSAQSSRSTYGLSWSQPATELAAAEKLLEEAVRLDPNNSKARGDLNQLRTIRTQLP